MSLFNPFQLLELNIISAQDLAPVSRRMKTYAITWVHPNRKLTTRVDYTGGANPTWNDKFVFRVNEEFLCADTSAVMVEIYALHWFRDAHVGTVRVLISNLIPANQRPGYRNRNRKGPSPGMRFVALQVRRASGRPQGILNIGVGLLDGSMRSMPLYTQMSSSAVGYRDLMGEEDPHLQHLNLNKTNSKNPLSSSSKHVQSITMSRPELRRTKSDTSSMVVSEMRSRMEMKSGSSSAVSSETRSKKEKDKVIVKGNTGSLPPCVESETPVTSEKENTTSSAGKSPPPSTTPRPQRPTFDSIDSEVVDPPKEETPEKEYQIVDSRKTPKKDQKPLPAASPYYSSSRHATPRRTNAGSTPMRSNILSSTPLRLVSSTPMRSGHMTTPMKVHPELGTPFRSSFANRPIMTNSELGPSPSEVAAQMAQERSNNNEMESSILSEWSIDDRSVEGLRTKLERWRTELPPLYDIASSAQTTEVTSIPMPGRQSARVKTPATKKHLRRHTDGGNGLFSCFSNICGVECSIVCGSDSDDSRKKSRKGRGKRALSMDNLSFS